MLKTVQWNVKFGMNYFFWLHFRFITATDCALSLAVISTANLQWDLQHSQKLYSVQPKYLQCIQGLWQHQIQVFFREWLIFDRKLKIMNFKFSINLSINKESYFMPLVFHIKTAFFSGKNDIKKVFWHTPKVGNECL